MMTRSKLLNLSVFVAVITTGGACLCQADRIQTVDGRIIEGIIQQDAQTTGTTGMLTIRIGSASIQLPRDQVLEITPAHPGENDLIRARDAFKLGQIDKGLTALAKALDAEVEPNAVAVLLLSNRQGLAQATAGLAGSYRQTLERATDVAQTAGIGQQEELMGTCLELYLRMECFDKAQEMIRLLGADFFQQHPDQREIITSQLTQRIQSQLEVSAFDPAQQTAQLLKRIDAPLAESYQIQIYLQLASDLRKKGQYEQAMSVYTQQLRPLSPAIAENRIRKTLLEAEYDLREANDFAGAAALYVEYGLPLDKEFSTEKLADLWHTCGWRQLRLGNFAQARSSFEQEAPYAPEQAKLDLSTVDYEQKAQALRSEDLLAHYELGVWAYEHGLMAQAMDQFHTATPSAAVGGNATAWIMKIRNEQAEKELLELVAEYEKGNLVDTLNRLHEFMDKGYGPGFIEQAHQLQQLCEETLRMRVAERPQQAEALFQRAQREFYTNHYDKAEELLKTVIERFPETVVAARARNFYAQVRDQIILAQLEKGQPATLQTDQTDTGTQATTPTTTLAEINRLTQTMQRTATDDAPTSR